MRRFTGAVLSLALLGGGAGALVPASPANAWLASRVYVSPSARSGRSDVSCATAAYRNINTAVARITGHGTVVVCRGTYRTQVVISKPVNLVGRDAVINAAGQKPIMRKLPGGSGIVVIRTSNVRVAGFQVINAGYDAILVALSSHILIAHNVLKNNGDVGVDFNGTSWSRASYNTSKYNKGGGFLVADDIGPTGHNIVSWNVASYNPGGCGVIIAGHSKFGVRDNWVAHNWLVGNGTLRKSPGAGVVIASPVAGETVSGNTVVDNNIYRNGLSGVTIHSHVRNQDLNGNRIINNWIGENDVLGDPIQLGPPVKNVPDGRTTGILVGSSSPLHVWIRGNHVFNNWYGVFIEGRVSASLNQNHFHQVQVPVKVVSGKVTY
jgi:hypothetical protein